MNKPQPSKTNRISIIWDFDKTLTPQDSTTEFIRYVMGENVIKGFWNEVKIIAGTKSNININSISSSEAPVWMYLLSEMAKRRSIHLDKEFFKKVIAPKINFYPKVLECLQKIKDLSKEEIYKRNNIEIHHFIITAGLQDLVDAVFEFNNSNHLITEIFGCRYNVVLKDKEAPRNIPIYCMDKTIKTRSLFEISKGCFGEKVKYKVDDLVDYEKEWCHFENMIYIGDGDTDIPAFSLVKSRQGMTIGVYDFSQSENEQQDKAKNLKKGKRIDLFTPAKFVSNGNLFDFIKVRCKQIVQRLDAHTL